MPGDDQPIISRLLSFCVTRLLIAAAVFYGVWSLGNLAWTGALARAPSGIVDRAIATLAALIAMLIVGGLMERRTLAELGFSLRNAVRELGLGLLLGAGLLTAIVGAMALCGWYQLKALRWQDTGGDALTFAALGLISYCLVAVLEEVLFRGLLLRILEEHLAPGSRSLSRR